MAEGAGTWIYDRGGKYQLRHRAIRGGAFTYETFASREQAEARKAELDALLAKRVGLTVDEAIDEYEEQLRRRGCRKGTLYVTPLRLRLFFAPHVDDRIDAMTAALCKRLYRRLVDAKKADGETPLYAVDTHRNALSYARTFGTWCVEQRYWRANHVADVKGEGVRRTHGKAQLRIDEARLWYAKAMELAQREPGAVAALVSLLLGLRASEIVTRTVRDLDDGGRLLWIDETKGGRWRPKTEAGRRCVEVPDEWEDDQGVRHGVPLRPLLLALAAGKQRDERLWPTASRYFPRYWVRKLCELAGVPKVSAHSMRGLFSTLATEAGAAGHLVAAALGHTSFATTDGHYVAPGTVERVRGRKALAVLKGGKR